MPNTRTSIPRHGLVFDMRQLGRQAGTDLTQTLTVSAPEDLRLELARVPVGADVELKVRFEAVTEGVLVTGTASAPIVGECARCLAPLTSAVTASFTELYLYPDRREANGHRQDGNEEPAEPDDDERYLDGDLLDLEPTLRDAVVLALPMSPRCRPDCPGLCVECGVPLSEAGPDHRHEEALDPRWASLARLELKNLDTNTTQEG
jgi:uncharacterized protein